MPAPRGGGAVDASKMRRGIYVNAGATGRCQCQRHREVDTAAAGGMGMGITVNDGAINNKNGRLFY